MEEFNCDWRQEVKAGHVLSYNGQSFINFRDFEFDAESSHRFQWIDLKKFDLSAVASDDKSILNALIASDEFKDDYVGGGVDPQGTRHGPYWLDRISADSYRLVGESTVVGILEKWVGRCGNAPRQLQESIGHQLFSPASAASSRYVLDDLGKSATNDYGDIHIEFHEIVLIDRTAQSVLLAVASDD
ncbi:hypothetical protein [Nocardia sp. R6R-6]|uniref:hypothetical protein n=1 Tax=Nocardia sp. R6R-6 TaxID=3459303 RepID=UPI00403E27FE